MSEETPTIYHHPSGVVVENYESVSRIQLSDPYGRWLRVHTQDKCSNDDACVIHNPSDHHMRTWPLNWRGDRGIMERICSHGVGHPDPDDSDFRVKQKIVYYKTYGPDEFSESYHEYAARIDHKADDNHGCDGCCIAPQVRLVDQVNESFNRIP